MIITRDPQHGFVRTYNDMSEAKAESIKLNKAIIGAPAFEFYETIDNNNTVYIGRLTRDFGDDKFRIE